MHTPSTHAAPWRQVCIFAYGQTGSGKTYTMLGNEERRGIIPRAIQQVFASSRQLATQGWVFTMQVGAGAVARRSAAQNGTARR